MDAPDAAFELPLFLLNSVLFPQAAIELRVFEPRYRKMVEFCRHHDNIFGVLLIRSGQEVGGPAEPFTVGTTSHIEKLGHQEDGTLALSARGVRKFTLHSVIDWEPFPRGLVSYLDDSPKIPDDEVVQRVRDVSLKCIRAILGLNGEWTREFDLPKNPGDLSYLIAARLPISLMTKQSLLETPDTEARLKMEEPLLERQRQELHEQLLASMWLRSFRLN